MDWLNIFKIVGYAALIFGAVCTVAIDVFKDKEDKKKETKQQNQMNELSSDMKESKKLLEPFSDLATKLYPNLDQKDALEKLRNRMDSVDREIQAGKEKVTNLSSQINDERKTIKSFDVIVSIEFSGKWDKNPYSMWYQPPSPTPFMRWTENSKKVPDLEFSTSRINYETINSNTGLFKNTLSIQPGQFPLGQLTDVLNQYDEMVFWMLLSWPENLLDPIIVFNKVDLVFFINGTKKGELHYQPKSAVDYSESLKGLVPGKAMHLNPRIQLNGRPVEVLKFNL